MLWPVMLSAAAGSAESSGLLLSVGDSLTDCCIFSSAVVTASSLIIDCSTSTFSVAGMIDAVVGLVLPPLLFEVLHGPEPSSCGSCRSVFCCCSSTFPVCIRVSQCMGWCCICSDGLLGVCVPVSAVCWLCLVVVLWLRLLAVISGSSVVAPVDSLSRSLASTRARHCGNRAVASNAGCRSSLLIRLGCKQTVAPAMSSYVVVTHGCRYCCC